jgi:hypothetical protein
VDPALAWAYKYALTRELARTTAFAPITDQLDAYPATGQWTPDRIADTLLRPAEPPVGRETAQATLATEAVRDRLRILAQERGTTITELLEELVAGQLTAAEQEQRARAAAAELGLPYTEHVQQAGQSTWDRIRAHQGGAAA